jgi:enterochelin esterase family protein
LKGYQYRYTFSEASGHVDAAVVNHTLPSALEWLWEGYRPR